MASSLDAVLADDPASPDELDFNDADQDDMLAENMVDSNEPQRAESNASSTDQQPKPVSSTNANGKPNAKDPLRPRRKKARRACYACQRAHLTCGDERPCQRCIKRGLQDTCTDGVRKKAKYLHDAPNEALIPPGSGGYYLNGTGKTSSNDQTSRVPTSVGSLAQASHYFAQTQPPQTVDLYSPSSGQSQMPPPLNNPSFASSQSPISPQFNTTSSQHTSPMQSLNQTSQPMQYGQVAFDPSDPAFFNLDISSLNFDNQYAAMEFGMLSHISSNAYNLNGNEMLNNMGQMQGNFTTQFTDNQPVLFGSDPMINPDWQSNHARTQGNNASSMLQNPNNSSLNASLDPQDSLNGLPQGYTIGAGPSSLASASPASQADPYSLPTEQPLSPAPALFMNTSQPSHSSPTFTKPLLPHQHQTHQQQPVQPPQGPTSDSTNQSSYSHIINPMRKRPHDADYIYESTSSAYSYTTGFHRLLNFIVRRFRSDKRIRIAKALSAIRPSLITFSQRLTVRDLVFMEVSVQRKLYEYADFINAYGTPTIITRRDGAVIAASKEFMILTGWKREVLLGREENRNVNTGSSSGAATTLVSAQRTREASPKVGSSAAAAATVATAAAAAAAAAAAGRSVSDGTSGKRALDAGPVTTPIVASGTAGGDTRKVLQPVLMAELMDQDSVVEFYEDYAKLAFNDAAGHACRRGRLLKYRTKEDMANAEANAEKGDSPSRDRKSLVGDGGIGGESGINRLGEKEGVVDCMYIWNVRRDIFEVPMLIVMNFLPII